MYLGFVLDLHLPGRQKLRVNPLGQPGIDILPWRPNRQAKGERSAYAEHHIPNNVPQICVQEEQDQVHDIHNRERERYLVGTKCIAEELVATPLHFSPRHHSNRATE